MASIIFIPLSLACHLQYRAAIPGRQPRRTVSAVQSAFSLLYCFYPARQEICL
nr:MAG TPA: hypothetical protein [Caudoviricetes sp.]